MPAFQASNLGSILSLVIIFEELFPYKLIFMKKFFKKLEFLKYFEKKNFFELSRQCIYLQLKKPLGIEIEMPIHKRLVINLLEGIAKRLSPGLIGLMMIRNIKLT